MSSFFPPHRGPLGGPDHQFETLLQVESPRFETYMLLNKNQIQTQHFCLMFSNTVHKQYKYYMI